VTLTWQRRHLHLHHPFTIARGGVSESRDKTVLLVSIEHDGRVGRGEAAPSTYYHQTLESNQAALDRAAELLGDDPFALEAILDRLWSHLGDQSAAIAAVDEALHDLCGQLIGLPVWKWFGLDPTRVPPTSFTIGIDDPETIAQKVREAADYPILKVKLGTAMDDDILTTVRREAPDKRLRVDANVGWSADVVLDRCRRVMRYDVELIEQPVPPAEDDALPDVREAVPVPLIADESCAGVDDVLRCAGAYDGINIKLSKCGGLRRALQMIHTARSAGLKVMLGCMVETSVGIAAAAQLAPLVDYLDLDGHLLLADDPFEGIGGQAGLLTLSDRPGTGVRERRSDRAS
jgi:L-alanine-DL-glutamate epimerase-like enolase superfamily enzyme